MRLLDLLLEPVPAEVRQRDQQVHQHRHLDLLGRLLDDLEDGVDDEHDCLGAALEAGLAGARVDEVGEHGGREVEAEHVYLGVEALLDQRQHPRNHLVVPVHLDDAVLHRTLLQDGQAEPLRDVAVVLLLQDLDHLVHHGRVAAPVRDVLDAPQRGHEHADQRGDRVPQRLVLDVQDLHDEVEAVGLRDLEDVPSDQFLDQGLPQLGRDLQGVDPEGQEDLDDALDVLILKVLLQLGLVLLDHILADELGAFDPALVDDDLVVLAQLDLVVLDGLAEGLVLVAAFLDVVDDLEQVDGDGEDLPPGLQHFLVLLHLRLVLPLQLQLVLRLVVGALQHRLQLGLAPTRLLPRPLTNTNRTLRFTSSSKLSSEALSYQYLRYSRM